MNSLKVKFLSLCCAMLMIAIGVTTWFNLQNRKTMLERHQASP